MTEISTYLFLLSKHIEVVQMGVFILKIFHLQSAQSYRYLESSAMRKVGLDWIKIIFFKDIKPIERSNMKCTRSKHSFFSSQISRFDTFSHENCRCLGKSKLPRDDCSCINVQLLLINNTWAGKILAGRFFEFEQSDTGLNH